ncbi:phosphatase PAP2 family protein [Paenibacillus arenilitoris]|uniref:Phosphatase PAP2 family protein n=1 Tax=Paenibacillus arenilitoris TaxID=2772299 RepID=A0A927CJ65_9BACL|nr:phosphatase PAP2 family protein [Paenibacillus arenilitoris]MBD2867697.1 phosphatase PAP2 family protein [Paenibacillus arenilitoris]
MDRMIGWLKTNEQRMLIWANRRPSGGRSHRLLGRWFSTITHMGGATFTLATALLYALLAPAPWNVTGWQCLTAVIISHIPVFIVKRKFKRLRPYQALPEVHTCPKPLVDSSFPSGHTTAIFAWLVPILLTGGIWLFALLPAALVIGLSVGWSRMYLGLHYPSDVAAGALIGTATAFAVHYWWAASAAGLH